jgi:hypothetical protein
MIPIPLSLSKGAGYAGFLGHIVLLFSNQRTGGLGIVGGCRTAVFWVRAKARRHKEASPSPVGLSLSVQTEFEKSDCHLFLSPQRHIAPGDQRFSVFDDTPTPISVLVEHRRDTYRWRMTSRQISETQY